MVALVLLALAPQVAAGPQHVPTEENFRDYLTFIQPALHEVKYREIGWRNKFWPAVQEARKLGRPILFWTMNGHPLGCT